MAILGGDDVQLSDRVVNVINGSIDALRFGALGGTSNTVNLSTRAVGVTAAASVAALKQEEEQQEEDEAIGASCNPDRRSDSEQ
jgi:hypothetical protein